MLFVHFSERAHPIIVTSHSKIFFYYLKGIHYNFPIAMKQPTLVNPIFAYHLQIFLLPFYSQLQQVSHFTASTTVYKKIVQNFLCN